MRLLVFDHSVEYGLALVWALCVLWQYWFRSFKFGGHKNGLDFYLKVNRFKGSFKGHLISKANCQAEDSSKERKNKFVFTSMLCVFVCILEESLARKKREIKKLQNSVHEIVECPLFLFSVSVRFIQIHTLNPCTIHVLFPLRHL